MGSRLTGFKYRGSILLGTCVVLVLLLHSTIKSVAIANQPTRQTVTVQINNNQGNDGGSGVIIEKQGNIYTVLTANHVVYQEGAEYTILTHNEQNYSVKEVKRIQNNPQNIDLAIVIFESSDSLPVATLTDSKQAYIGSKVSVGGYPLPSRGMGEKRQFTLTFGTITAETSNPNSNLQGYTLQHDVITIKGMSGGPIFDTQNRVLAIHGQGEVQEDSVRADSGETIHLKTGFNRGIPIHTFLSSLPQFELKSSSLTVDNTPTPENIQARLENPTTSDDFYLLGLDARKKSNLKQAIDHFNTAIKKDPNHDRAYFQRGITYSLQHELEQAIADYTQAIKNNPSYADAYYNRGLIRGRDLGDYREALADFNQVIRLTPRDADAYANRGNIYFALQEYRKAIEDYTQAIQINQNSGNVYYNRGIAYGKLGDFKNAEEDCQKAARIFRSQNAISRYQEAQNCLEQIP